MTDNEKFAMELYLKNEVKRAEVRAELAKRAYADFKANMDKEASLTLEPSVLDTLPPEIRSRMGL